MAPKSIVSYPVEVSLRLIGAWPNSSCRILKNIIWTTTMSIFLAFQYWYCITHIKTDILPDLLDGLSITLSNTLLFIKFIIIWLHKRRFSEILIQMADDWDNCKSGWNMEIMIQKAGLSHRIAKLVLVIFTCTAITYAATIFLVPENDKDKPDSNEKKLLLRMEFPFDGMVSPVYEIILTTQVVIQSIFVLMAGMCMALIATFVLHVASQIDVFCDKLTQILDTRKDEELRISILSTLIVKHQKIISLSANIDSVFTFISLLQFLFNILVICFLSFILTTSINTDQGTAIIMQCIPYYIAINFEALVLCYTGEYLTTKSENISWIVYNSNWYELSIYENRILLLLLLRSQKTLTLTIGKLLNLSLETFASMLKASASYVSVLYAYE